MNHEQVCNFIEHMLREVKEHLEERDGGWEIFFEEDMYYFNHRLVFKKGDIHSMTLLDIDEWDGVEMIFHKVMEATTNSVKAIKFKEQIDEERCNVGT